MVEAGNAELGATVKGIRHYFHPRMLGMLFLGFSAGLPLLLIFSSLSLWLREAGIDKSAVTYFSWAALGYSFKFVWAPLVDKLPLPILATLLGQRRSWLLLSQIAVTSAIVFMAMSDPATEQGLKAMAIGAVMLGFSSATQDIVIDAYRIEAVEPDYQAMMSSIYVAGYRIGMFVAGAISLYLASGFGTSKELYVYQAWQNTYLIMAATMLLGVITTLVIREPISRQNSAYLHSARDYSRFVGLFVLFVASFMGSFLAFGDVIDGLKASSPGVLSGFLLEALRLIAALATALAAAWVAVFVGAVPRKMVNDTYLAPVSDFFIRYGRVAFLILLLVGLYRISDIVLGAISNVFYQDMGFTKNQIATVTKVFGLWMTLLGGFLGGFLTIRYGVMRILMLGAVMTVLTNLLFILQAQNPGNLLMLYGVIGADNLTGGLAVAAFIAYLSSLTSLSFTAIQYAIFSSLMTLFPKLLAGYSGSMVEAVGYETFFLAASLLGIPVFLLVWLAAKYTDTRKHQ